MPLMQVTTTNTINVRSDGMFVVRSATKKEPQMLAKAIANVRNVDAGLPRTRISNSRS